jgi:hypothetical protein
MHSDTASNTDGDEEAKNDRYAELIEQALHSYSAVAVAHSHSGTAASATRILGKSNPLPVDEWKQRALGENEKPKPRRVKTIDGKSIIFLKNASMSDDEGDCPLDEIIQAMKGRDKEPYTKAKEQYPRLIQKESNPKEFLFREQSNANAAAWRLVWYWKNRSDLFGQRAYHSMTQTGEGALNRGDLDLLSDGVFLVLPNDASGNSVFCMDCSKIGRPKIETLHRVAFYMLQVACEMSTAEDKGIVGLFLLGDDATFIGQLHFESLLEALPSPMVGVHLVAESASSTKLVSVVKKTFGDTVAADAWFVHNKPPSSAHSKQLIERLVASYGFQRESLPKAIGGGWGTLTTRSSSIYSFSALTVFFSLYLEYRRGTIC